MATFRHCLSGALAFAFFSSVQAQINLSEIPVASCAGNVISGTATYSTDMYFPTEQSQRIPAGDFWAQSGAVWEFSTDTPGVKFGYAAIPGVGAQSADIPQADIDAIKIDDSSTVWTLSVPTPSVGEHDIVFGLATPSAAAWSAYVVNTYLSSILHAAAPAPTKPQIDAGQLLKMTSASRLNCAPIVCGDVRDDGFGNNLLAQGFLAYTAYINFSNFFYSVWNALFNAATLGIGSIDNITTKFFTDPTPQATWEQILGLLTPLITIISSALAPIIGAGSLLVTAMGAVVGETIAGGIIGDLAPVIDQIFFEAGKISDFVTTYLKTASAGVQSGYQNFIGNASAVEWCGSPYSDPNGIFNANVGTFPMDSTPMGRDSNYQILAGTTFDTSAAVRGSVASWLADDFNYNVAEQYADQLNTGKLDISEATAGFFNIPVCKVFDLASFPPAIGHGGRACACAYTSANGGKAGSTAQFSKNVGSKVMEIVAPAPVPQPNFPTTYDICNPKQYDGTG